MPCFLGRQGLEVQIPRRAVSLGPQKLGEEACPPSRATGLGRRSLGPREGGSWGRGRMPRGRPSMLITFGDVEVEEIAVEDSLD